MNKIIRVYLRGWRPNGGSLSPDEFIRGLATDTSKYELMGSGKPWQAAKIALIDLSLDSFNGLDEPSEVFHNELKNSLLSTAVWLTNISTDTLQSLRHSGLNIDLFFDVWIDSDQIELNLPSELLVQMGRLQLPIKIISND